MLPLLTAIPQKAQSNAQTPASTMAPLILTTERFSIHYTRNVVSTDFGGEPCLLVYYDYTNNGDKCFQRYGGCKSHCLPEWNFSGSQPFRLASDDAIDAFMKEIQPGETVNVCQAFSLQDMSPVTLTGN